MYMLHLNRSNGSILYSSNDSITLKMADTGWQSKNVTYFPTVDLIFDLACRHALVGLEERKGE